MVFQYLLSAYLAILIDVCCSKIGGNIVRQDS